MRDDQVDVRQELVLRDEALHRTCGGWGPRSAGSVRRPTVATTSTPRVASPARMRSKRSPDAALKIVPRVT
ncbi:hypothetical protein [Nocardioides sp. zg-1228]|uniref:hypothetical protein n=1 Tax=Nocardioides sp. zg-1228 TaxID=2763008 RepID=UPI001643381E|nr:hypothetical protein [Nocardioides sp. zg-1228]MBC2932656.1 hypothetical protein [Nocardioides sp. zg-1228]QSF58140.1 hypothetical protein JX575_02680 [Nocardioides sp. zg-1228]